MTPQDAFKKYVNMDGPVPTHVPDLGPCWVWTGATSPAGYGAFRSGSAHRASYRFAHGEIPPGMVVMHRCDNPACVRPEHLQLGTYKDNVHDMFAKGRERCHSGDDNWIRRNPGAQVGSRNFNAKLSAADVVAIRRSSLDGVRHRDLARHYGVSSVTITSIMTGRNWGSLPWSEGDAMHVDCCTAMRSKAHRSLRSSHRRCASDGCNEEFTGLSKLCVMCRATRRLRLKRENHQRKRVENGLTDMRLIRATRAA